MLKKLTRLKKPLVITGINYKEKEIKKHLINKRLSRVFQLSFFLLSRIRELFFLRYFLRAKKKKIFHSFRRAFSRKLSFVRFRRPSVASTILGRKLLSFYRSRSRLFHFKKMKSRLVRFLGLRYHLYTLVMSSLRIKTSYLSNYINKLDNNIYLKYSLTFFRRLFKLLFSVKRVRRRRLFGIIYSIKKVMSQHLKVITKTLDPEVLPYYFYLNKIVDYYKYGTLVKYILVSITKNNRLSPLVSPIFYVGSVNAYIRVLASLVFVLFPNISKYFYFSLLSSALPAISKYIVQRVDFSTYKKGNVQSDLDSFYLTELSLFKYNVIK